MSTDEGIAKVWEFSFNRNDTLMQKFGSLDFQTLLVLGPLQKLLLPLTFRSNNIPAKNSKSCSFSTLLNHQNMVLDGNENSWMVMSTTPQIVWVVMKILGW